MSIKTKLIHLKLQLFRDKEMDKKGTKIIPCKICNKPFRSYEHYGEWTYVFDDTCESCKNNGGMKKNVQK